eukprot:CAMPEP_0117594130 /NCGR_PEP_ID=MMETSP0784-20121206/73026_1 /TAXON_ID=39447 /ORGANISM="" /LENGTH=585 /DNA_ID=CAMNT_0005396147 /DNA_START=60 /DNA_END=1814 /DNA_ORIENTATION=-
MVELDPVVIFTLTTAVVGIATVAICVMSAPAPKTKEKVTAPPKQKKKSKGSKNKSSGTKSGYSSHGQSSTDERKPVPVNNNVTKPKIVDPTPEITKSSGFEDDEQDADDEDMALLAKSSEITKKAKKAKETAEQKAARLQRQKATKSIKHIEAAETATATGKNAARPNTTNEIVEPMIETTSSLPAYDGWAVVEDKRKVKSKKDAGDTDEGGEPVEAPSSSATESAPSPVPDAGDESAISEIGLLIGPKGVTKIGMQTATGTEISMPKVEKDYKGSTEISVMGPAEGVARAVHAINELCAKGYCNLLAAEDFHEGYVAVHPRHLPDIIGKGGACIKAIQAHTGVKISTPTGYTKTTPSGETIVPSKVKINLAGSRDKISLARQLILDLTKYFHTPITHPGITHTEMDVPSNYYNYIIGSKGSEIKHIQSNYKVTVHAVAAERAAAQAAGVALGESAKAKLAAQQAAGGRNKNSGNGAISLGGGGGDANARPPRVEKEEPEEEWVSEYAPRSNKMQMDIGSILPATAKFSSTPPAATVPQVPDAPPGGEPAPTNGTTPAENASSDEKVSSTSAWGGMGALQTDRWG